ncbi:Subunit of the glycosylphosphatidylinositol transamidase complex-like protein, partial [Kappamyces sp. JEL0829]
PITTHRYLGGSGQERGSIKVEFANHQSAAVNISYLESIPWILKTYLHTFSTASSAEGHGELVRKLLYTPAIDRERPTVIEVLLTLPPLSTTYLSIDYECAFVKVTEHHPDANHGFDIGIGVVQLNASRNLYTEPLLIRLPTPDFSMPYNVITLTCTALSMYFGSIFNLLTRKYMPIPQ